MVCLRRLFSRESRQPTAGQGRSSFKSLGVVGNPQSKPPQYPGPHSLDVERIWIDLLCRISLKVPSCKLQYLQNQGISQFIAVGLSSRSSVAQLIFIKQTRCVRTGPGDFSFRIKIKRQNCVSVYVHKCIYIHMYTLHVLVYDFGMYLKCNKTDR